MNHDQLQAALDRYGGDLDKWPAADRDSAKALAAADTAAERMLAAAARLDALMAEVARPAPVDAALIGRIVAGIGNGRHREVTVRPTARLMAWSGAAMALFLFAGFAIGLAVPADQGEDTLAGLMFGGSAIIAGEDGLL